MSLVPIDFPSVYFNQDGSRAKLNSKMALCTPDMKHSLLNLQIEVKGLGGNLYLSDLFRSFDMQLQAYLDYQSGKKKAFSPHPVGGMHEAGRAFDLGLSDLKIPLKQFWDLAKKEGIVPIISKPDTKLSEAWHFEKRGSHQLVNDYMKGLPVDKTNFTPAQAMAISATLESTKEMGGSGNFEPITDKFGHALDRPNLLVQFRLIRLGYSIGSPDGKIGPKTRAALADLGFGKEGASAGGDVFSALEFLDSKCEEKFPQEYFW